MTGATYSISTLDVLSTHGHDITKLLHDYDNRHDNMEVDALVASGDCFATLASTLDEVSDLIEVAPDNAKPQLEQVIQTLIYMQRVYKPIRKHPKP